jgi:L-ornithine N5-monooxygenase
LRVRVRDSFGGAERSLVCHTTILATGYDRELDPGVFADLMPYLARDAAGEIVLSRHHRVQTRSELPCGLYLQGFAEASFGPSDTLLSLLPFRAAEIVGDIAARSEPIVREYPPARHIEHSPAKLFAVIERFPFATLISARGVDDPLVTHLPLILDRTRGHQGILFGHVDRSNPQAEVLDGRRVTAIFHGPNSYISPHVYSTNQLPTWNSINVHVSGRVRVLSERAAIIAGLCKIAACSEDGPAPFRLFPDDPRIDKLIDHIVAFELEIEKIVGRFKLSQDRNDRDRQLAGQALARRSEQGERAVVEYVLGCPLSNTSGGSVHDDTTQARAWRAQ